MLYNDNSACSYDCCLPLYNVFPVLLSLVVLKLGKLVF